uniref:Uncharacterized protein n=1 Tax=Rhizophagus irregularis (strain DAOM 181602 / DAOM 197198 / MUCL 43194) TaxID=747089 RepID=U9THM6_RHIID
MCKLHTYYITNAKYELPYYAVDTSEFSQRKQTVILDPEHKDYDIEVLIVKEINDNNKN